MRSSTSDQFYQHRAPPPLRLTRGATMRVDRRPPPPAGSRPPRRSSCMSRFSIKWILINKLVTSSMVKRVIITEKEMRTKLKSNNGQKMIWLRICKNILGPKFMAKSIRSRWNQADIILCWQCTSGLGDHEAAWLQALTGRFHQFDEKTCEGLYSSASNCRMDNIKVFCDTKYVLKMKFPRSWVHNKLYADAGISLIEAKLWDRARGKSTKYSELWNQTAWIKHPQI